MRRPLGVTLVALLQFLRAGVLLLAAAITLMHPDARVTSDVVIRYFIYFKEQTDKPYGAFGPAAVAVISAITGCGLWRLKRWAAGIAVSTSVLTLYAWVWPVELGGHVWPRSPSGWLALSILIVLDVASIFYLSEEWRVFRESPRR